MTVSNPPKALILLAALLSITLLMALERVSTEAGLPIISACVFYGIGNGVAARKGVDSSPVIGAKRD